MYSCGQQDNSDYWEESRRIACFGRQQSHERHGEFMRHHRDLRPDHVLKGVIWELERAAGLHGRPTGRWDKPVEQSVLALTGSHRPVSESTLVEIHETEMATWYC